MRYLLPAFVAFFFIIEGTWFQVFFPPSTEQDLFWVPRFAFVTVILISIYRGSKSGIFYGMGLGLFQDIVYSTVIGIYTFSYALIGYMTGFNFRAVQSRPFVVLVIVMVAVASLESLIYLMYTWTGIAQVTFEEFAATRLLPSVVLNGAFGILLIFPLRKFFVMLEDRDRQQENV
ncbi:hypothetical protein DH09_02710 [Bacillaceae bacterium JMAK1]|nr:hypothetical protein DH09_02710 [Bacillaceae bacterium JMAK1]